MYQLSQTELRKLQLTELSILREVKRICEKHTIPYYLIGGTLIGAVRHKGFIPWDDDIDIAVLRPDFDRFCSVCAAELDSRFFLQTPDTEHHSADFDIARIRLNGTHFIQDNRKNSNTHDGIYVEVFPYDNLPNFPLSRFFYGNWYPVLKRVYSIRKGYTPKPRTFYAKAAVLFFKTVLAFVPTDVLRSHLCTYHQKYQKRSTKDVFLLSGAWGWKKEKHSRSHFRPGNSLFFEDDFYSVPHDYHSFLTHQYGNYMQLPPESKQKNRHRCLYLDFGIY